MNEESMKVLLDYLMRQLIPAFLIFMVGWFLIRYFLKAEGKVLGRMQNKVDASQVKFFVSATKVALWTMLVIFVLKQMGINTAPIITVYAAMGAALALALQGSLSNLASGILMLFTKPFVKGDVITCAGMTGVVQSMDLFYTSLLTFDDKVIGLPNSMITSNAIINATTTEKKRVELMIRVSYDADLDKARQTVLSLADSLGLFLEEPVRSCSVCEYEENAVKLRFWGWVNKQDQMAATDGMNNGLKPALEAAGVPLPLSKVQLVGDDPSKRSDD